MIDLRSDTATRPTAGMRAAIAAAAVGDEQKREDPTVNELEARGAVLLGQEEAVFLPTATMANQIALRLHTEPGDELLGEENCHVFISELGGPAVHSGVVTRGLPGVAGRFTPEQVRAAYRRPAIHSPRTRVVWVENSHNASGGRVWPLEEVDLLREVCDELELRFHLDGARLMNAAVASGAMSAAIGRRFDTVTICLSKGLGCPLGALLAGSEELMARARRFKHLFGGAFRQAGIVAAAGVVALQDGPAGMIERLADDHANARLLADALASMAGIGRLDPARVRTNFVIFGVGREPDWPADREGRERVTRTRAAFLADLHDRGVHMIEYPRGLIRAIPHYGIERADIETTIGHVRATLAEIGLAPVPA